MNKQAILTRLENNMRDKFAYIPRSVCSMDVFSSFGPLVINSHQISDMFNIVCCLSKNDDLQSVDHVIDYFKSKALPAAWWVGFQDDNKGLIPKLKSKGMTCDELELTMVCDLLTFKEKDYPLEINRVATEKDLDDFISVLTELLPNEKTAIEHYFQRGSHILLDTESRLKLFVGYLDKKPVSTSSCFLAEGIAGIFDVITLESARGKGIGTAMTHAAMKEGQINGYSLASLSATNSAKYVYQKMGFEPLSEMGVYTIK